MKILVGIKQVPDTETKIRLGDGATLDESGVKWIVSPYDEYALEQALLIREAGEGEVLLVCAGRETAQAALRQGLAMGADRAVLIAEPRFDRCDALLRARALAGVARAEAVDLILLGKYGVGTDEWQTGPMLAELLDWPHVTAVSSLELTKDGFRARRAIEGATEIVEGRLPVLLTCDKGLNEPRYASLKGIMQAKKKPLETLKPQDVGIAVADFDSPKLTWESLELPAARSAATLFDGPVAEQATQLVRKLREEAKVI